MRAEYLGVAQTAKLVRAALARAFPGVKFSVRSQSYSGGCSVNVRWTDGPTEGRVSPVAKQFEGKRFDGSIDLGWSASLWLLPDGTATVASDAGSAGSGGSASPVREWMPHPEARLICTGAWVFCTRETGPALAARVRAFVARRGWQRVPMAHDAEHAEMLVAHRAMLTPDGALVVVKHGVT